MTTEQITVSIDQDVAAAYRRASAEERRKLDMLVSLRLREATQSAKSLAETAQEVSKRARERGLTPEILRDILDD